MSQNMTAEQRAAELAALDRVRRRILAIGFFAVVSHGVVALIYLSVTFHDQGRTSDAVILLIMSALVALVMVVVMRIILGHNPASPLWLAIALAPTALGAYLAFG